MTFSTLRRQHKDYYNRWYQMTRRAGSAMRAYQDVQVDATFQGHQGFVNFYHHMGLPPTSQHQMDRIDPFGHYEPGNLRWVTPKQNCNNMRVHHVGNGRHKQLAIDNGINTRTYYKRVREGWDITHAATWPTSYLSYQRRLKKLADA